MTAYLISLALIGLIAIAVWGPHQKLDWSCRSISLVTRGIGGPAEEIEISPDKIYVDRIAHSMATGPGWTP